MTDKPVRGQVVAENQIAKTLDQQSFAIGAARILKITHLARQVPCIDVVESGFLSNLLVGVGRLTQRRQLTHPSVSSLIYFPSLILAFCRRRISENAISLRSPLPSQLAECRYKASGIRRNLQVLRGAVADRRPEARPVSERALKDASLEDNSLRHALAGSKRRSA
jgi:hypothetical protein